MSVRLICISGKKGCGKTTVMEGLLPELGRRGCTVGTLKNDHHGFELDTPGKDTWRHKRAGAAGALILGPGRIGLVLDLPGGDAGEPHRPDPADLARRYFAHLDLVLAEGFSAADAPKIEVFRPEAHAAPLLDPERGLAALVTDAPAEALPEPLRAVPRFALDDAVGLADFVLRLAGLTARVETPEPGGD
ncbi:MAG: molybdopterin-guanine dinucleotide biosynthesis protein B [Desulfovibrionaceae bacterium]